VADLKPFDFDLCAKVTNVSTCACLHGCILKKKNAYDVITNAKDYRIVIKYLRIFLTKSIISPPSNSLQVTSTLT
jgi:hypothetical protein